MGPRSGLVDNRAGYDRLQRRPLNTIRLSHQVCTVVTRMRGLSYGLVWDGVSYGITETLTA